MTKEERARLLDIRWRGKRARPVSKEEHDFCERMWEQFPEEYREVENEMHDMLRSAPWWELT